MDSADYQYREKISNRINIIHKRSCPVNGERKKRNRAGCFCALNLHFYPAAVLKDIQGRRFLFSHRNDVLMLTRTAALGGAAMKHTDRRQIQTIFALSSKSPATEQAPSGSRCENCHSVSEYWSFCARIASCCPGVFSYLWGRNIGSTWPEPCPGAAPRRPVQIFPQKI